MITAIIVDDEQDCAESLVTLLEMYCPEVKILDICHSAETAFRSIREQVPAILFLDIEMPVMNGFQLLEKLGTINFQLIFTTSYDQYAIKAIRFSALEYLLKPIDREELQDAVRKALQKRSHAFPEQFEMLMDRLKNLPSNITRIAIPTMEGFKMLPAESIIRCASDGNYTVLFLKDRSTIVSSRSLKEVEEMLEDQPFLRVHHSWLVNLNEIEQYVKGEGGYLMMSDGSTVNVSRSRKEFLLKTIFR
ncbi:MAG TPA: LytTR family DNA-binding domain-containing protein [Flavitalea sp.]|nr:LytTR family DNA-binding domain-containing protein [Flavitalea sp.]